MFIPHVPFDLALGGFWKMFSFTQDTRKNTIHKNISKLSILVIEL